MACPLSRTVDGFESQLQVNYLSHWLLIHLLCFGESEADEKAAKKIEGIARQCEFGPSGLAGAILREGRNLTHSNTHN